MNDPLITVLMPAYNAGKYIGDAIRSVLAQTYADFELVIINDGSVDQTVEVIRSFADPRIVLLNEPHAGVSQSLNKGLLAARGKYIARFDADDIAYPQRLSTQLAFLITHPDYVAVGSDADYMLETGEHLFRFSCIAHSAEEIADKMYFYCPFIHSSVMYLKKAVIEAGGYSLLAHNFEDYLLWTQLSKLGRLQNLPEALISVRFNPASVTMDERWRGSRFRQLKKEVIHTGTITPEQGDEIKSIILSQNKPGIKKGAYYALCAKKFMTDNYQPGRARSFVRKAIAARPFRLDNYALWIASYLPVGVIQWLHQKSPNRL